jgi:tRNA A-37 threonylcarbamoyl transferase component Bud32
LAVGRPGHFRVVRAANGLPDANHVVVSPDGTAWLSGSNGLFRWQYPFRAEFWNARDGLDLPYSPLGVAGRMFAISGSGLAALSAGRDRWLTLGEKAKLGLRKLFPGPGSTLYATSTRAGVVQFDLDGALVAQSHTRLPTSFYQYLVPRTPLGPIWFSDTQISRLTRNGRELRFALAPLSAAPDQKLAACYAGGLVTLDGSETHHVSTSDGLLEHSCMCLKILPNGDVWYGYISADAFALIRRDTAGRVEVRQYHSGDDHTFSFDADSRRWIWRGGVNAMHVADTREAQDGNWIDLNATDGFHSSVLAEAFFAASDGSVWWGTQDSSIYHFTPSPDFVRPTHPPSVFLSGYSWNGGPPQFAEAVRTVPYGANLTALVGSLQFDRRNAMRFRYRLTPDQPSWRDTRSFDIAVGKLHWGSHKLELQAKLLNGPWSAIQSEVFEVAQPFWATWPFLFGCAGVGLSGAAAGYRWRRKLRARAEKAFPNLAEWRLAAFSPEAQGLIGQVLDSRYRLNRVIARGGFATVLDGIDLAERNRPCAVKVFRRELSDKDWLKSHFEREVSALAQVQHPNVVRIYSHGTTPTGAPYLAMEFIAGQTLRELLNEGPLSARHSATLLRQAGAALEAIHACGICHRDVKPENLMIRSAGPVEASLIVIDFSIAIVRKPDETIHGLSRAAGTIYYMAPEQAIGYADVTTDIYSLAKVLLEMLTGARLSDLLPDASMDLPNRVRELLSALPVRLSTQSIDLIASALEFDPARRPRSVRDFAELIAVDLEKG